MQIMKNLPGLGVILRAFLGVRKYEKPLRDARAAGELEQEQALILQACQQFSRQVADGLAVKVNIINPENLPKNGPAVYISNHQSYADILVFLYAIDRHQVSFIAKDSLKTVPFVGAWIDRIRGIFIHRGDARAALTTINEGVDYLKQGFSLVIFPEGTRSQGHEMADFKPGSLKLATKARVPLVPVTIDGSYRIFEETGRITKGMTVDFLVHPPIDTASLTRQELAELPQQVEETVRAGLAQHTKPKQEHDKEE